jgi:PTH1 family peptidyl-tRNA hydrolase
MSHLPKLLVAGLGNLPFPNTRHRYFFQFCKKNDLKLTGSLLGLRNSLGHLIIDQLAWRTGIRMSPDRDGFSGESIVTLGKTPLSLTLFKSSTSPGAPTILPTQLIPDLRSQNT